MNGITVIIIWLIPAHDLQNHLWDTMVMALQQYLQSDPIMVLVKFEGLKFCNLKQLRVIKCWGMCLSCVYSEPCEDQSHWSTACIMAESCIKSVSNQHSYRKV